MGETVQLQHLLMPAVRAFLMVCRTFVMVQRIATWLQSRCEDVRRRVGESEKVLERRGTSTAAHAQPTKCHRKGPSMKDSCILDLDIEHVEISPV